MNKRVPMTDSSMIRRDSGHGLVDISRIFDLSDGGIGFLTRDEVSIGQSVSFKFFLPKKAGKDVSGVGHIVWATCFRDVFGDNITRCGMKFNELNPDSGRSIREYIRKVTKDS